VPPALAGRPAGRDASSGSDTCKRRGVELGVRSTKHLRPCPSCGNGQCEMPTGGDAKNDPYTDHPEPVRERKNPRRGPEAGSTGVELCAARESNPQPAD
jgi:hypothetical protein